MEKNVTILFGGGKESVLSLHLLRKSSPSVKIKLLHYNYGQTSYRKDKLSGIYYARLYDAKYVTRKLHSVITLCTDAKDNHIVARNSILIAMAVNYCVNCKQDALICPFTNNSTGHSDSTHSFLRSVTRLYKKFYALHIYSNVRCASNRTHLLLLQEQVDISHVWSCEKSGRYHCGTCVKCADFLKNVADNKKYSNMLNFGGRKSV